ncbi:MAG: LamG domain-containing protein [Parabacteroides sp.]|nr:LamG domain-containing protein [Parabacteroides sp.]
MVRFKANQVRGYTPVLSKAGNDQSIAYSIALNKVEGDTYIECLMGYDEIAGAQLLKYKLPEGEETNWHDVLLRFNGRILELYVDGQLRDDEVTVGEIRDWNGQPLLIGAQYKEKEGYGDNAGIKPEFVFNGLIDHVVLWNRYLSDDEIMKYSGVETLKDGKPDYYSEIYRPQFHFTAKKELAE